MTSLCLEKNLPRTPVWNKGTHIYLASNPSSMDWYFASSATYLLSETSGYLPGAGPSLLLSCFSLLCSPSSPIPSTYLTDSSYHTCLSLTKQKMLRLWRKTSLATFVARNKLVHGSVFTCKTIIMSIPNIWYKIKVNNPYKSALSIIIKCPCPFVYLHLY